MVLSQEFVRVGVKNVRNVKIKIKKRILKSLRKYGRKSDVKG